MEGTCSIYKSSAGSRLFSFPQAHICPPEWSTHIAFTSGLIYCSGADARRSPCKVQRNTPFILQAVYIDINATFFHFSLLIVVRINELQVGRHIEMPDAAGRCSGIWVHSFCFCQEVVIMALPAGERGSWVWGPSQLLGRLDTDAPN